MKNFKCRIMIQFLILPALLFITFANAVHAESADTEGSKAASVSENYLEIAIKSLENRDVEMFAALWPDGIDQKILSRTINEWDGMKVLSYKKVSEEVRHASEGKPSGMIYQYELDCEQAVITVELSIADDVGGEPKIDMFDFHVTYKTEASKWAFLKSFVWILYPLNGLEIVFTILTAIHCIIRKKKYRVLWCLFIILVYGGISLSFLEDFVISFYVYILSMLKIVFYPEGAVFFIGLPIGAFIYWIYVMCQKIKGGK